MGKAKIADVAKFAGVSPTTVSHALSGRRPVGEEIRKRVMDAVRNLDYKPNYMAYVNSNKTQLVCVLTDQCVNPSSAIYIDAIERELRKHGYETLLAIAGLDLDAGRSLLRKFSSGMVSGIINMLPQLSAVEAEALANGTPVVTHIRQANAPVYIDHEGGARQAFEYLRGQGHRRIGYIGSQRRNMGLPDPVLTGCRNFLAANGESFDPSLIVDADDTLEGGRIGARMLLQRQVSAIFAANDQMALGVYQSASALSLRIPQDLSVIGYDDNTLAISVYPLLTTVQVPFAAIATHTVDTLIRRLNGIAESHQPIVVRPQLIVRDSVTLAPGLK